ncbi:protein kinase family protein [Glycomyces tarimensis]
MRRADDEAPDQRAILARFGREPLGAPVPLAGGEDNRNTRIATDAGDLVVREYLRSGAERVRAELRLVDFLARSGFPTPGPLIADTGEPLIDDERPIAVFPFVPGDVPAELTVPLAERCGEALARMHALTADWDDEALPELDRIGLLRQAIEARPDLDGVEEWHESLRKFLERHEDDLARIGALPAGPLHHDLHRQNLLVEDGELTAVLDFDEVNRGPLVIDLARAWCYLAVDGPDRRLPPEHAYAVVRGYERVRPLGDDERELLPVAFDLAALVDAAGFITWAAADLGLAHVDECESWMVYRRSSDAD